MKMNRKNPYGDIGRENYWQTVRRRFLHHRLACISLVVLAVIVSLIFLNTIYGVRKGTLIAAFTIGNFSRFFRGYTNKLVREVALQ